MTPDASRAAQLKLTFGQRTYVMGIVNCSPESFSGDGIASVDQAIAHGLHQVEEGADLLDIGGESTRPGVRPITIEEELARVVPVFKELARQARVPISVDTYHARVAQAALEAGASIINDQWALARDPEMAGLVARVGAYVILMHNRSAPPVVGELGGHYGHVQYETDDIVEAVASDLAASVQLAVAAGIRRERIIIDPGIGFGKSVEQNLEVLARLNEIKQWPELRGLPLLIGTSRKSVIGFTLGLPPDQRLEGTLATLALAIEQGTDIVRVHDVRASVRACRMADAIVRRAHAETR